MIYTDKIQENFTHVLERIVQASARCGRDPDSVKLVVVTKTHSVEAIQIVISAGARYLGENYADEALPKIQELAHIDEIEWHMIGHVQSRKAQMVVEFCDYLHSLDSLKLADRLNRFAGVMGRRIPVLIECNTSAEESKYGYPAWEEATWDHLVQEFSLIAQFPNLELRGLMTMAPYVENPELARPYYQRLRRLKEFLGRCLPEHNMVELSMGMSGDFEVAIEEGATWIRVGTGIFGPRVKQI